MLSRPVAALVRSLLISTPTLVTVAAAALTVGCKDESQPEYWVEKLSDRAWQGNAVKRMEQFFEDTFTRTNKDLAAPDMKALADKLVEPLTKLYVDSYSDLDDKTRESVVKLIGSFRDPRGEPALKKAFEEFAKSGKGGEDVKWAARAAKEMKADGLAESLGQAFDKLKAASKDGAIAYRDLNEALLASPSKSWSGLLRMKLAADIERPADGKDAAAVEKFKNELFWQNTAAQLLGELRDESAVEPLVKIMLDPAKADIQATAVLALVKLGKPAAQRVIKIVQDQDPDMASFAAVRVQRATGAKEAPKDRPHLATGALILGVMGRSEAVEPLTAALADTKLDEVTRAVMARELGKLPATAAAKQAFKTAFESISLETQIPPGAGALHVLAETAGSFYDPEFVDWLLDRADKTKGSGDEKTLLQSTALVTAIKLMKPDQVAAVGAAVTKWGTQLEKDAFAQAGELLKACGTDVSCYLANIEKSENQQRARQSVAIKAGYMVGILGDEKARVGLIDRLGAIDNAAVRFVASQTIDFLSPKGSAEAAAALEKIIDKNARSADKDKAAGDAPLKQVMYRIRARAE
ncbi:MAG: HEAT repeat domain-containing protein [Deltaproteobacteria bacterium]|nr:HEAT repeat domain-containing protein [Deltaproteobacteria bacterium]